MISKKVEKVLNSQIKIEGQSSMIYLAMACWAESNGYNGTAQFLYRHSDEEREHMLKLIKFVNERGGTSIVPAFEQPKINFKSLKDAFETLLNHELHVTASINDIVDVCLKEKDHVTNNFMQWYVSEQIEEEALARTILDKVKLIGNDKGGIYMFDRDLEKLDQAAEE